MVDPRHQPIPVQQALVLRGAVRDIPQPTVRPGSTVGKTTHHHRHTREGRKDAKAPYLLVRRHRRRYVENGTADPGGLGRGSLEGDAGAPSVDRGPRSVGTGAQPPRSPSAMILPAHEVEGGASKIGSIATTLGMVEKSDAVGGFAAPPRSRGGGDDVHRRGARGRAAERDDFTSFVKERQEVLPRGTYLQLTYLKHAGCRLIVRERS